MAEIVKLCCGSAEVHVALQGAHVVYWKAQNGQEVIYTSPTAIFSEGVAIRGGVPICWPQFSDMGPGKVHGYARNNKWMLDKKDEGQESSAAVFALPPEVHPPEWAGFGVTFLVRLGSNKLELELAVANGQPASAEPKTFTGALHTYFAVPEIANTTIEGGLDATQYLDNLQERAKQPAAPIRSIDKEVDRIYLGVKDPVVIRHPGSDRRGAFTVTIASQGFPDIVLWNPWIEKAQRLKDLPDEGYHHFVCVESAVIAKPVVLQPGSSWTGVQSITVATTSSSL